VRFTLPAGEIADRLPQIQTSEDTRRPRDRTRISGAMKLCLVVAVVASAAVVGSWLAQHCDLTERESFLWAMKWAAASLVIGPGTWLLGVRYRLRLFTRVGVFGTAFMCNMLAAIATLLVFIVTMLWRYAAGPQP
jgi:hypothetical protein